MVNLGLGASATGEEVKIEPNQMALFTVATQSVEVENVDPYGAIAWKDGKFVFEDEPIEEIMERLSRWYDVKVFYANEHIKEHIHLQELSLVLQIYRMYFI